jgi:hypothetical protein
LLFSPLTGGTFTVATAESDALEFEAAFQDEDSLAAASSRLRIGLAPSVDGE